MLLIPVIVSKWKFLIVYLMNEGTLIRLASRATARYNIAFFLE